VDVREPDEVARLPLPAAPHARNVPLDALRERIAELDPSLPTIVACWSGLRAHVAVRLLAQNGFADVRNLSGGAAVRDFALNPIPEPTDATPTDAVADVVTAARFGELLAKGDVDVVDVRTGAEHRACRVRGARHVPLESVSAESVAHGRPADAAGPTYLLCKGGSRARMAAAKLRAAGVACVVVEGGTDACVAAGLPTERDATSRVWPIERQVRLVAGLLVSLGAAVGAFVTPWGYGLCAFVGVGLVFAGATDFCGMALLLGRCPWNK